MKLLDSSVALGIVRLLTIFFLAATLLQVPSQYVHAANSILYASPSGATNGSCNSWANACRLHYALSIATAMDEIWVMQGTYKPTTSTDRTISFILKDAVALYGGFTGTETLRSQRETSPNFTILSGEIGSLDVTDNSYHVVIGSGVSNSTILDGFTITAGNANDGSLPGGNSGGGLYIDNGDPVISNSIFQENFVGTGATWYGEYHGGAIYVQNGSPSFEYIRIIENSASQAAGSPYYVSNGGGMYILGGNINFNDVLFSDNSTGYGGGIYCHDSTISMNNVNFNENIAVLYGGGLYNEGCSITINEGIFYKNVSFSGGAVFNEGDINLNNIIFDENKAINYGGGGMVSTGGNVSINQVVFKNNWAHDLGGGFQNAGGNAILNSVTFSNNSAVYGGGFFNGNFSDPNDQSHQLLINVTFSNNQASYTGGAIENRTSNLNLTNITFNNNIAGYAGGAIYNLASNGIGIKNSILWGNFPQEISGNSLIKSEDNIVSGGCPSGATCTNTLTASPKLGPLTDNGGFTQTMSLEAGSSAIDAGGINSICAATDQRNVARPQGGGCDIGAYEKLNDNLVNSVLPTSRSIQSGNLATIFHTLINAGSTTAQNVNLSMGNQPSGTFEYQQTDCSSNSVIGPMNPVLDIQPGGMICYILLFTPSTPFDATNVQIRAEVNSMPVTPIYEGINTWLLRSTSLPGPDIIAQTTTADFHQATCSGASAFAVALSNVGAAAPTGDIIALANTGSSSLPVEINILETDPVTGAVIGGHVLSNFTAGDQRTVGVFVTFNGCIPFDPALNRIFIEFRDASNSIVGSTSTAVSTNR